MTLATNLATFEAATTQSDIYEALVALDLDNVDVDNVADYESKKQAFLDKLDADEKELTKEAVQAFVDKINAEAITADEEAAIVKAVLDAEGNNVKLKAALSNKAFTKVNNDWIENVDAVDGYATELVTPASGLTEASEIKDVQTILDAVNEAVIAAAITANDPDDSIDKKELTKLQSLIETYAPVDEEGEYATAANQTKLDTITLQLAVVDVLDATTASKFKATVTALAPIANEATPATMDLKEYVDGNGKAYIDVIKDLNSAAPKLTPADYGVTDEVNTAAEVQALIKAVNQEVKDDAAVKDYKALATAATNVIADATASNKTKYVAALQAVGIKQVSSNAANVAEYVKTNASTLTADVIAAKAALVKKESEVVANKALIQTEIDNANLAAIAAADTADKVLAALKVLELDNIIDANKEAYLADKAGYITDVGTVKTAVATTNSVVADKAEVKAINAATTATEVKTALDKLAISDYVNVPSADKLYIAEKVLEARDAIAGPSAKEFANKQAVTTALGTTNSNGVLKGYADLIAKFEYSKLTDISKTVAQLSELGYTAFDELPAGKKADVAEAFKANYPQTEAGAPVNYTTLAAVKAGVDKAITAVAE